MKLSSFKSSCHVITVNSHHPDLIPEQFVCVLTETQTLIFISEKKWKVKSFHVLCACSCWFSRWSWITNILADHSVLRHNLPVCFRELIRCLKWYMDRSAEVVRQDHIQEAMRVRTSEAQTSSMMWSERKNTLLPGVYLIYLNTRAVIAIYIKQLQARKLTNFCSSVFYVCSLFTNIELLVFLWFLDVCCAAETFTQHRSDSVFVTFNFQKHNDRF